MCRVQSVKDALPSDSRARETIAEFDFLSRDERRKIEERARRET